MNILNTFKLGYLPKWYHKLSFWTEDDDTSYLT